MTGWGNLEKILKRFDNFFKVVKSRPPIVQPIEWAKI